MGRGMLEGGSITAWIGQLHTREEEALARLHRRLWPVLLERARRQLNRAPIRFANEEDVAQEAFWAFFRALKAGKVPQLANRHDLLAFLTHIMACKACNLIEGEIGAQKRGLGRIRDEAALRRGATGSVQLVIDHFEGPGPSPLEQTLLEDCYEHFVGGLSEELQRFATLHLLGYTNQEVAQEMDCHERTVARKLALIRAKWTAMAS